MPSVLMVDDDPYLLVGLCAELKRAGFATAIAKDGLEGFEMVRRQRPDVILCDVMMPGWSGWQFKQQLNQDPELATIPVVFLTGRDVLNDRLLASALGAAGFFTKPVKAATLIDFLNKVLARE